MFCVVEPVNVSVHTAHMCTVLLSLGVSVSDDLSDALSEVKLTTVIHSDVLRWM